MNCQMLFGFYANLQTSGNILKFFFILLSFYLTLYLLRYFLQQKTLTEESVRVKKVKRCYIIDLP